MRAAARACAALAAGAAVLAAGAGVSSAAVLTNFGGTIGVAPCEAAELSGDGLCLDDGTAVRAASRVIARAAGDTWDMHHPAVERVQRIAPLQGDSLFLLHLSGDADPFMVSQEVSAAPAVRYAQPDLLQLPRGSTASSESRAVPTTSGAGARLPAPLQALNLPSAWAETRGAGVAVAVIDDGFDLDHPQFAGLRTRFAYDADARVLDPAGKTRRDRHGTPTTSLIFARHDGVAPEGVAPEAELIAIRQVNAWTSDMVIAFAVAGLAGADVINCSWELEFLPEPLADAVAHLTEHGRGGLGALVVFAAGNGGRTLEPAKGTAALRDVVMVGSTGPAGRPARHSNRGAPVACYMPGTGLPAIGAARFTGTSGAAALFSGAAALLLSADPQLKAAAVVERLCTRPPQAGPDLGRVIAAAARRGEGGA